MRARMKKTEAPGTLNFFIKFCCEILFWCKVSQTEFGDSCEDVYVKKREICYAGLCTTFSDQQLRYIEEKDLCFDDFGCTYTDTVWRRVLQTNKFHWIGTKTCCEWTRRRRYVFLVFHIYCPWQRNTCCVCS